MFYPRRSYLWNCGVFRTTPASYLWSFDLKVFIERQGWKCNTTGRRAETGRPQDESFKGDRDALRQTTLKTCLLSKWIWGERNKISAAGPVIRRL